MIRSLFKNLIINNDFIRNSLTINFIYIFYSFFKTLLINGFKIFFVSRLKKDKNSDTLIILGTGNTINELSDNDFIKFKDFDVAGLSYSLLLSTKQTYYFFESPRNIETLYLEEFNNKLIDLLHQSEKRQFARNIIWKNSESNSIKKFLDVSNYHHLIVCHIISNNAKKVIQLLNIFDFLKLNRFFLLQSRGSISALMHFAKSLNYRRVIFSGVDLNNEDYFFLNNHNYEKYKLTNPNEFITDDKKVRSNSEHFTNDPKYGIKMIDFINHFLKSNKDIEFFVTSKKSMLSKLMPVWKNN